MGASLHTIENLTLSSHQLNSYLRGIRGRLFSIRSLDTPNLLPAFLPLETSTLSESVM